MTNVSFSDFNSPEFRLEIESEHISVNSNNRVYTATWSLEAIQDLNSQYNINAEEELLNTFRNEIAAEIDREILIDLRMLQQQEESLYISPEAVDDVMAWVSQDFEYRPIKHYEKVNWKQEGF